MVRFGIGFSFLYSKSQATEMANVSTPQEDLVPSISLASLDSAVCVELLFSVMYPKVPGVVDTPYEALI